MSDLEKSTKSITNAEPTRDQKRGDQKHPTMPPGRSDTALKRYENLNEDKSEDHKEHSLQAQAKERAEHPENINAGTPYDWEDLEVYKKELERLDKNPPKSAETP